MGHVYHDFPAPLLHLISFELFRGGQKKSKTRAEHSLITAAT